ncbi:MAG TPA: glycosyltransferase [Thermoanaerobaculia bacterium]|nr:glycosyltransferase [Thermoanaerobaculia bacterium]
MLATGSWWLDRAFIYVGRMDASKGVDVIIRAYAALAAEHAAPPPLWLAGGIPAEIERLRSSLRELVEPLEQRKLLVWWGFQRPAVVSGLLSRSLVLLMHSQYEPGGRVVLEGLAAGLPVIATANGFARELVRDWVTGFLVPYGDTELLRARMAHFIRQPLLRNAMSGRARAAALAALSAWRFVDAHCDVYDAAIAQSARERGANARADVPPPEDVLHDRAFEPTYPWSHPPADLGLVESFLLRVRNTLRVQPDARSGSRVWTATDSGSSWVVKQVEGRFAVRPLWDPSDRRALLRTADERFAAEVFASTLPQFVPLASQSAHHRLILRPAGLPIFFTCENLPALFRVLRALSAAAVAASTGLDAPASSSPDDRWQCLHTLVRSASVPGDWTARDTGAVERCADLAARADQRIGLAHGRPHPEHFVRYGDEIRLISGGDLAAARIGHDAGWLLLHVISVFGLATAMALVRDCDSGEAAAVLAWAALYAAEGLYRSYILRRQDRVRHYRDVWTLLQAMLPA